MSEKPFPWYLRVRWWLAGQFFLLAGRLNPGVERNAAFARMTGIKKVCMDCGQTNLNNSFICPGKRPEPKA